MAEHQHMETHIHDENATTMHMKHDHDGGEEPHSHKESEENPAVFELWEDE